MAPARLALEDVAVATPERVALGLPIAGIGYRCLAYLVDLTLLFFFWVSVYFVYSFLQLDLLKRIQALSGLGVTLVILGAFATQWLYWTVCEVAFRGQTPGKRVLRVRVVRLDGSSVGFFESAVRNLCRAVDFLPAGYAVGILVMLVTRHHVRLGDLLAGTVLVREERVTLDRYAGTADSSFVQVALNAEQTELILEFLARAPSIEATARARLGAALWQRVGGRTETPTSTEPASAETVERQLRALVEGGRAR